jgi:superfamily II DNA or RNA helicase
MRFGKTVCALWLIEKLNKELGKKKVLIVTHRPVVNASWYGDFKNLFKDSLNEYSYGTSKETDDESGMKDFNDIKRDVNHGKCALFFVSMQYLRLSDLVGGKNDSQDKKDILNYDWDLVIIDEAHEGTQTELGGNVVKLLRKKGTKLLALSGTPFNLLSQYSEDNVYTWDYVMEQRKKDEWDLLHHGDHNPYAELPKKHIYTYDLGEKLRRFVTDEYDTKAFNFREFFRVW